MQGKLGNIAQVYPTVEYDFIPNNLQQTPYIYNVLGLTLTTMGGMAEMDRLGMKVKVKTVGSRSLKHKNS